MADGVDRQLRHEGLVGDEIRLGQLDGFAMDAVECLFEVLFAHLGESGVWSTGLGVVVVVGAIRLSGVVVIKLGGPTVVLVGGHLV